MNVKSISNNFQSIFKSNQQNDKHYRREFIDIITDNVIQNQIPNSTSMPITSYIEELNLIRFFMK